MKTIVAHISIDLDAVAAIWLIRRFFPGWSSSKLVFVPAGTTLNNKPPDENPEIIHVDTGLGKFDHHQTADFSSATQKTFNYAVSNNYVRESLIEALQRLVSFVTHTDHFKEADWPDPTNDRYDFCLHQITKSLIFITQNDEKVAEQVLTVLDAVMQTLISKVRAEEEIKTGFIFKSKFGRSLALESQNEEAMKLALKQGYGIVIRRDPKRSFVRIKIAPDSTLGLDTVYQKIKKIDKQASWFLHVSKRMLLNGSANNPSLIPSRLTLPQVIEIVKKI